jgi:hypothetical protein
LTAAADAHVRRTCGLRAHDGNRKILCDGGGDGFRRGHSYWGSYTDLEEVLELARAGGIRAQVETFPLDQVDEVLNQLERGKINGRAVITP